MAAAAAAASHLRDFDAEPLYEVHAVFLHDTGEKNIINISLKYV